MTSSCDSIVELHLYNKSAWFLFTREIRAILTPHAQRFAIDEVIAFAATIAIQRKVIAFTECQIPCKCAQLFAYGPEVVRAITICAAYIARIHDEMLTRIRAGLPLHNGSLELGPAPSVQEQYDESELIDETIRILRTVPTWREVEKSLATLVIV